MTKIVANLSSPSGALWSLVLALSDALKFSVPIIASGAKDVLSVIAEIL